MKFSTQKYSSNIIEKCMDCCDEDTRELIANKYCEPSIIEKLLFDMYGNYVLQKIISISKEPLTSKYLSIIGPLMKKLNSYSFGQKLYNKLLSSFPNLSAYVGIKNEGGKNKKFKNKKSNYNNMNMNNNEMDGYMGNINNNMNGIGGMNNKYNNLYNNGNQMMNMKNNKKNNNMKFSNNPMFMPGMNNFYFPFQLNNMNSGNNMYLQNMINNNSFPLNYNNPNNINNFIQLQQQMNNNNVNNMPNSSNDSNNMINFNNQ
jgi:hypothetical protein